MASYSVLPGDLWLVLGSPPSRKRITSVERLRGLTFETPATYLPSHLRRNLKFLYGSNRFGLTGNSAMRSSSSEQTGSVPNDVTQPLRLTLSCSAARRRWRDPQSRRLPGPGAATPV